MPMVLDISSDEEQGFEEATKDIDLGWIKELLEMSDDEESDDSDEVVIIRETKPELKSKSSKPAVKDVDDDDDDDCVVLDGDPENGVTSVDEDTTGSDEVVVVGEKGQVACRDYPHARHLCAKFPFSSTPPQSHCDQCHCYVCDSLAPCLLWGTGNLSTDHCHANDKTETWKLQRKNFKLGKTSPLPASTNYDAALRVGHPHCNRGLTRNVIRLSPNSVLRNQAARSTATLTCPSLSSVPQSQASHPTMMRGLSPSLNASMQTQFSRPNNIPLYSTATTLTVSTGATHGRCQKSESTLVRNRYQPHLVPRQMLGVRSHAIQRERGSSASSLGPQLRQSPVMSKGVGHAGGTLTVNRYAHKSSASSNHVNPVQHCDNYHSATGFTSERNDNGLNGGWLPAELPLCQTRSPEPDNLSCAGHYTVASNSLAYSKASSQPDGCQYLYQPCMQGSDAPSSYVAYLNNNEHQIRSQNENASENIAQCGIANQRAYQPNSQEGGLNETTGNANYSAFDSTLTENVRQNIEPLIDFSHPESSGSSNQPGRIELRVECSQVPSVVLDIENWLLEKDSVPMGLDGALLSELNIPSPDLSPIIDNGMPLSQWW